MYKIYCIFLSLFVIPHVFADDCLGYKLNPTIKLMSPQWSKSVVQPLEPMDLTHGHVSATMVDNYEIVADVTSIEDGFCVGLKAVDAIVGYSDFLVNIDIRHRPDSCSYNAILSHEDEHIRAYISVIDDNREMLNLAIKSAADSIVPIFVSNASDIDGAVDKINIQLQSHPDLILAHQKLKADEEIRNKRVDINENNSALQKCGDF
ncbi:MAG: hypothetical protein IJ560_03195 [Alphaproteobacteria bacterium]|nr:hypothetical protein [Alphaproteobacteria bacterium]